MISWWKSSVQSTKYLEAPRYKVLSGQYKSQAVLDSLVGQIRPAGHKLIITVVDWYFYSLFDLLLHWSAPTILEMD